jgi:hypothetical protein
MVVPGVHIIPAGLVWMVDGGVTSACENIGSSLVPQLIHRLLNWRYFQKGSIEDVDLNSLYFTSGAPKNYYRKRRNS